MNIEFTVDPLFKFTDYTEEEILTSLGFLPEWVINSEYFDKPLVKALDEQYGYGLYESSSGSVTEDGIFQYPNDPDMYPLIKIQRGDETFYQYLYGMVSIVQKDGSSYITRLD